MKPVDEWIGEKIPEDILDEAAVWIARLDSDQATRHDRLEFARWLDKDPVHQHAFQELSPVWARMSTLGGIKNLIDNEKVVELTRRAHTSQQEEVLQPAAAPAWQILAVLVFMVVGFLAQSQSGHEEQVYETELGGYQVVELDDGSIIHLNTDTRVHVKHDSSARTVWIEKGEAYFDVAKDKQRPFRVVSEFGQIAALGTEFLVKVENTGLDVAVFEGLVEVEKKASEQTLTEFDGTPVAVVKRSRDLLAQGEALNVSNGVSNILPFSSADAESAISWRQGKLLFEQQPLTVVLREMERYAPVRFLLVDKKMENIVISGSVDSGDAASYINLLKNNDIFVSQQRGIWQLLATNIPEK